MFDVGFAEIFLLALIGLLVLGPERLPGVARTIGGFVRKARTSWISLRNTIESELAEADLATPIKKTSDELKQIGKDLADMQGFDLDKNKSATIKPDSGPVETAESDPGRVSEPGEAPMTDPGQEPEPGDPPKTDPDQDSDSGKV